MGDRSYSNRTRLWVFRLQLSQPARAGFFSRYRRAALCASLLFLAACSQSAPESERTVATRVLAEYIASTVRPKTVLVLSNPFSQQPGKPAEVYAFERAGLQGLQQGFGGSVPLTVAFPRLKDDVLRDAGSVQIDPQTTTPLSFLVAQNAFSEVIQQHPNCEVVVSLIGLPVNLTAIKEWTQPAGPKFALLLPDWRMIGGRNEIIRAFREKKLIAAIVNKPQATGFARGTYKERFENRFFLVTAENIDDLLTQHPAIFSL